MRRQPGQRGAAVIDLREAGGDHKGVLVALWLKPDAARQLAKPGGEAADTLHITLAYCDGDYADAVPVVRRLAAAHAPFFGAVRGTGRFPASETSDGKDVLWAKPVVEQLAPFRAKLAAALTAAGVVPRSDHAWNPHITIAYVEPGSTGLDTVPSVALRFEALTLAQGDRRQHFPFRG